MNNAKPAELLQTYHSRRSIQTATSYLVIASYTALPHNPKPPGDHIAPWWPQTCMFSIL